MSEEQEILEEEQPYGRSISARMERRIHLNVPDRRNPRLRQFIDLVNGDDEIYALWLAANVNAIERLGMTDHGPVHVKIVMNIAVKLFRLLADAVGLESVDREAQTVVLRFRQDAKVDPTRLFKLVQERGDLTLVPPATLKLSLSGPIQKPAPVATPAPATRQDGRITRSSLAKRGKDPVASGSWWAARAQSGDVTGGFSRQEILKPAKDDPRGETGVFARVSSLLRDLNDGL